MTVRGGVWRLGETWQINGDDDDDTVRVSVEGSGDLDNWLNEGDATELYYALGEALGIHSGRRYSYSS